MREVDTILRKLDKGDDIAKVRNEIADLIGDRLRQVRASLGYWEKAHFANAIAALAWNIKSRHQPTASWLRLCLVNLEKALVPAAQRNENYTSRDHELDALTYDQLAEALEFVRSGA